MLLVGIGVHLVDQAVPLGAHTRYVDLVHRVIIGGVEARAQHGFLARNRQRIVLGDFTAGLDGGDCVHHEFSELKVIS